MLRDLGYEIAGLSTHLDHALTLAHSAAFDIALLDINLNGRQSFPVADAVRARGLIVPSPTATRRSCRSRSASRS
jgi:DNA-binding response OmpR family regulator